MSFKVEYFTLGLDATTTAGMKVSLSGTPTLTGNSSVALDIISGTSQFDQTIFLDQSSNPISPDFLVDGTFVRWDSPSYSLYWDGTTGLTYGDKIRVIYNKL
jgi:hypothetical protein